MSAAEAIRGPTNVFLRSEGVRSGIPTGSYSSEERMARRWRPSIVGRFIDLNDALWRDWKIGWVMSSKTLVLIEE